MKSKLNREIGKGLVVLLVTVFLIPGIAGAFGPEDRMPDRGGRRHGHHKPILGIWRNPQLVQELELTEEQVKQMRDADFAFRAKRLDLKAELDGLRLEMDKAFSAENVDRAAVLLLSEKIADVDGKMFIQKIESRLALAKILNKNQVDKLKSLKRDRHKNKDGRKKSDRQFSANGRNDRRACQISMTN